MMLVIIMFITGCTAQQSNETKDVQKQIITQETKNTTDSSDIQKQINQPETSIPVEEKPPMPPE